MNKKVLLIGCNGSIGRRYAAILKFLGIEYNGIDVHNENLLYDVKKSDFSHCIIATPTNTHFDMCKKIALKGIPFLCEKPLSKSPEECKEIIKIANECMVSGFVVNNWAHTYKIGGVWQPNTCKVFYDNYHTGKDGLLWDCCQLVYLSDKAENMHLLTLMPYMQAMIGGYTITHEDVAVSYIKMIRTFTSVGMNPFLSLGLWSLRDGLAMTEKVIEYQKKWDELKGKQ